MVVEEDVNAVEATLVTPTEDPLLATVRESAVAVGLGQVRDALVSSARVAVSSALKRATSREIVQIIVEDEEVVEAAPLIVLSPMCTTAETVETATAGTVETATAEIMLPATAVMVIATTDEAHTLAAALPVTTIAEMEIEAVMETEAVMKWVSAWVRHLEGTTRDRHLANKKIATVTKAASE